MLPDFPWQGDRMEQRLRYPRELNGFTDAVNRQWVSYTEDLNKHVYYRAAYDLLRSEIVVERLLEDTRSHFHTVEEVFDAVTIDVAFDQNSRPMVAWSTEDKKIYLYFFDSLADNYVKTLIGAGERVALNIDNPDPFYIADSDVQMIVQHEGKLYQREQRERFLNAHLIKDLDTTDELLITCGATLAYRFAIMVDSSNIDVLVAGPSQVYIEAAAVALRPEFYNGR